MLLAAATNLGPAQIFTKFTEWDCDEVKHTNRFTLKLKVGTRVS